MHCVFLLKSMNMICIFVPTLQHVTMSVIQQCIIKINNNNNNNTNNFVFLLQMIEGGCTTWRMNYL